MKTILMLSTVPDERPEVALQTAREIGLRTVMCAEEYDEGLAGAADSYYVADWSDPDELLRIAREAWFPGARLILHHKAPG